MNIKFVFKTRVLNDKYCDVTVALHHRGENAEDGYEYCVQIEGFYPKTSLIRYFDSLDEAKLCYFDTISAFIDEKDFPQISATLLQWDYSIPMSSRPPFHRELNF